MTPLLARIIIRSTSFLRHTQGQDEKSQKHAGVRHLIIQVISTATVRSINTWEILGVTHLNLFNQSVGSMNWDMVTINTFCLINYIWIHGNYLFFCHWQLVWMNYGELTVLNALFQTTANEPPSIANPGRDVRPRLSRRQKGKHCNAANGLRCCCLYVLLWRTVRSYRHVGLFLRVPCQLSYLPTFTYEMTQMYPDVGKCPIHGVSGIPVVLDSHTCVCVWQRM